MDRSLYLLIFLLFLIGETTILSVNTLQNLWETPLSLGMYKKPILQAVSFFAGLFIAFYVIPKIGHKRLKTKRFAYGAIILSTILLMLVLFKKVITGKSVDRWLLGSSVQPMEFTKLAVILFISYYVWAKGSLKEYKYILWSSFLVLLNSILLFLQPDRGSALFILILSSTIFFVGGLPFKVILPLIGSFAIVSFFMLFGKKSYVHERIDAWIDPFKDPEDAGYQIIQSLYALADGGLLGKGIGKGIQKMGYLPQADTDFVIAVMGEELGFWGLMFVFLIYAMLVFRLFYWALRVKDIFGKLVLFGIGMNFTIAFLWNVGMATNLLPPKGIALPFISYGSSNIFMSVIMIGIAQEVIRHDKNSLSGGRWDS